MKGIAHKNELGSGFYTVPDISRLLCFSQDKVRRYLNDYWDDRLGRKLFSDTYTWSADNRTKAVNFYVLIELYTFFKLQEFGVKTATILKARDHMAKETKSPYPFAANGVLTNGKKIWYEFKDAIIDAENFWPAGRNSSVVVNPHNQFGQPIIKGSNVNTEVLFSMYKSGEPIESIGILYDLTEREVKDAIRFYKKAA